jgi:hypothetical protein
MAAAEGVLTTLRAEGWHADSLFEVNSTVVATSVGGAGGGGGGRVAKFEVPPLSVVRLVLPPAGKQ